MITLLRASPICKAIQYMSAESLEGALLQGIVDARYAASRVMHIAADKLDTPRRVRVSVGDGLVVESARRLASDTGIGLLISYNLATNLTHFAMACVGEDAPSALTLLIAHVPDAAGHNGFACGTLVGTHTASHYDKNGLEWEHEQGTALEWLCPPIKFYDIVMGTADVAQ